MEPCSDRKRFLCFHDLGWNENEHRSSFEVVSTLTFKCVLIAPALPRSGKQFVHCVWVIHLYVAEVRLHTRSVYTLNLPACDPRGRVGNLTVEWTIRCKMLSGFRPCEGAHQRALTAALTHHDRDHRDYFSWISIGGLCGGPPGWSLSRFSPYGVLANYPQHGCWCTKSI